MRRSGKCESSGRACAEENVRRGRTTWAPMPWSPTPSSPTPCARTRRTATARAAEAAAAARRELEKAPTNYQDAEAEMALGEQEKALQG